MAGWFGGQGYLYRHLGVPVILDGYVENGKTYIKTATSFSDKDITVIDDILCCYGRMTAKQLVELTHQKDGLWYASAERNHLFESFEQKVTNNSDCQIDLGECLTGCSQNLYSGQMGFLKMSRAYGT